MKTHFEHAVNMDKCIDAENYMGKEIVKENEIKDLNIGLREQLVLATLEEVGEKNLKFTMDDLAKKLGISKKTIYTEFRTKDELISEGVDYYFSKLKDTERRIILDDSLDIVMKLKKVLIAMPDGFLSLDFRQMAEVKLKYPSVYEKVAIYLDTGWEPTLNLYRIAIKEGRLRDVPEVVFKHTVEGAMKEFLSSDDLENQGISYFEALEEMVEMIFRGLEL